MPSQGHVHGGELRRELGVHPDLCDLSNGSKDGELGQGHPPAFISDLAPAQTEAGATPTLGPALFLRGILDPGEHAQSHKKCSSLGTRRG